VTGKKEAHLLQARAPTLRRTQMRLRVSDILVRWAGHDRTKTRSYCI
jgi:hypothetical protein